jgi:hypothetical protein
VSQRVVAADCMGGGRPAERRFTVGGSGKSVARCHRTVLAHWKFESISLQQTVRLSPDFAFVPRKARVFRQFEDYAGRRGRQRRAKPHNIEPTSGSVSVSLSSYIPVPQCCWSYWMRFARLPGLVASDAGRLGLTISVER